MNFADSLYDVCGSRRSAKLVQRLEDWGIEGGFRCPQASLSLVLLSPDSSSGATGGGCASSGGGSPSVSKAVLTWV